MPEALRKNLKPTVGPLDFGSEGSMVEPRRSLRRSSVHSGSRDCDASARRLTKVEATTDNESMANASGAHGKLLTVEPAKPTAKVAKPKVINSTSKLAGSLFAAKLMEAPRRRNTFSMPESIQAMCGRGHIVPVEPQHKDAAKQTVGSKTEAKSHQKLAVRKTNVDRPTGERKPSSKAPHEKPAKKAEADNRIILPGLMTSPVRKPVTTSSAKNAAASPIRPTVMPGSILAAPLNPPTPSAVKTVKKVTLPPLETAAATSSSSKDQLTIRKLESQLAELQAQFEQLSILRHTSAEKLLEDFRKQAASRDEGKLLGWQPC